MYACTLGYTTRASDRKHSIPVSFTETISWQSVDYISASQCKLSRTICKKSTTWMDILGK